MLTPTVGLDLSEFGSRLSSQLGEPFYLFHGGRLIGREQVPLGLDWAWKSIDVFIRV
jgi:hypothetical protein